MIDTMMMTTNINNNIKYLCLSPDQAIVIEIKYKRVQTGDDNVQSEVKFMSVDQ